MTPLQVKCPNGHGLKVPEKLAGKKVKCPKCEAAFVVPVPASVSGEIPSFLEESSQDGWEQEDADAPTERKPKKSSKKKPESNGMGMFYAAIGAAASIVIGVIVVMVVWSPAPVPPAPPVPVLQTPPPAPASPPVAATPATPEPPAGENSKSVEEFKKKAASDLQKQRFMTGGLAFHNYYSVYNQFPVSKSRPEWLDESGRPKLSWRVHILPYIDQLGLYQQFHLDEPWDSPHNLPLLDQMPDVFRAPEDALTSNTTRVMVLDGPGTLIQKGIGCTMPEITDGTSNTILFVLTAPDKFVPWTKPEDAPFDPSNSLECLGKIPEAGIRATMADGSTRLIPATIPPDQFKALATINGGEPVQQ